MILLRFLLVFTGIGLLVGAAAILAWDLYQIFKARRPAVLRWRTAKQVALFSMAPLLVGLSSAVVPSGSAGVRVNQFAGTRPGTLYPGVHWIVPLIESVETYNIRDSVFTTSMIDDPKKEKADGLRVQTREGLMVGLAVAVRYRLDPSKLAYIHSNLPHPVEEEMIAPAVASVLRDLAPADLVREMFSNKRDEIRQA